MVCRYGRCEDSCYSRAPISIPLYICYLVLLVLLSSLHVCARSSSVGCADGTREGLYDQDKLAVCSGHWYGHVHNGSNLCARGWQVCSWQEKRILRNITWQEAMTVEGCYAYNAAQDGGRCQECRDNLEQDDLAGIGKGCPHQNLGQGSCITGGRIDASCCVDSHFRRACSYQPGLSNGVLCCKIPAKPPRVIVRPKEKMHVFSGLIFLLTCQATGSPPPRTQWYKDGRQLPHNNSRISVLKSGDLLVTLARSTDSGMYTCEVINEEGIDMATSQVVVTDYASGCADGSTEGLLRHRDVHACAGRWFGHVKRAKHLCSRGWTVCNPKDRPTLTKLTWSDMLNLKGCYAINAANVGGHCSRCHSKKMAGVGNKCGYIRLHRGSCLPQGRVDVFDHRGLSSCNFKEGLVTGALCCRKKTRRSGKPGMLTCDPPCQNGGFCVGRNRCHCAQGYKGAMCQNPICKPACEFGMSCIKPGKCSCRSGIKGKSCRKKLKHRCRSACLNGGRCRKGRCKCPPTHWGRTCDHEFHHIFLTNMNRTER